jgi:hypothetical protein
MKYWEIIARNIKRRRWSLGWVSAVDSRGRTIWIVDAHRDDGKRFVVRADEKLTAFLELEPAFDQAIRSSTPIAGSTFRRATLGSKPGS